MAATSRIENRIEKLFGAHAIAECRTPQIADARAAELVRNTCPGLLGAYAEAYAHLILRSYLLAAALSGANSAQITTWAWKPGDSNAAQILKDHAADVPQDWILLLEAGLPPSDGLERAAVFNTLRHALHPDTQPIHNPTQLLHPH